MHTRVLEAKHGPTLIVRALRHGDVRTVMSVFERLGEVPLPVAVADHEVDVRLVRAGLEALISREAGKRLATLGGTQPKLGDVPRRRSA